jgi:hypothetical protein
MDLANTVGYSTLGVPSLQDVAQTIREAKRKIDEIKSKIDPAFRNLRYPILANMIESHYLTERLQVKFPRSKKKRIRRKWAKDQRNWKTVPQGVVYVVDGRMVMHPDLAGKLAEELGRRAMDRIASRIYYGE